MYIKNLTPIREEEGPIGVKVYYQSPIGIIYAMRPVAGEFTYWYTEEGDYFGYSLNGDEYISKDV